MFHSIVVPVDLSDPDFSRFALDRAVPLARLFDARLTLVNVVPVMPMMMMDTVPVIYEGDIEATSRGALARMAEAIDLPAGRVCAVVRLGSVQHEVLEAADEAQADLVVIGSHQPDLSTYILGSNATAVVRHATCSVLVLRHPQTVDVVAGEAAAAAPVEAIAPAG